MRKRIGTADEKTPADLKKRNFIPGGIYMTDIRDILTSISLETDVIVVNVFDLNNTTAAIADLFTKLGADGININMIALNPSCKTTQTLSFTANAADTTRIIRIITQLQGDKKPRIELNAQNCIATFCGQKVDQECGICAFVFDAFSNYGIRIKLITTSKRTIACLFDERYYGNAVKMFREVFREELTE